MLDWLIERLTESGAKEVHRRPLLRAWLRTGELPLGPSVQRLSLPASVTSALAQIRKELAARARVVTRVHSSDGSIRHLVGFADGSTVETVLLPRGTLCVSTQVGCAVGCTFCQTGDQGLLRQLSAGEILAQLALVRAHDRTHDQTYDSVRRIVFMGMGEPAHNLDALLASVHHLGTEGGFRHEHLMVSTVGDERIFSRLATHTVRPSVALSLHTTDAELRRQLLPRAAPLSPEHLVALTDDYAKSSRHPAQYAWTLLAGVNDRDEDIDALAQLMQGRFGIVNLIPFNRVDGKPFERPAQERTVALVRRLHRAGVRATIRRSGGQDVDAACGQLRSRLQTSP